METLKLLHNCPLYRDLDQRELESLAEITSIRRLKKSGMIFFEGDPATGFYVLLSGLVRVYKASPDGREYTLHRIRPGQTFAEAAVFGGGTFPANSVALEDSIVAFLPKERFLALIKTSPEMSLKMLATLSAFVRDFNQQIEDLSLKEVSARIASYLLRKAEQSGSMEIMLEVSKAELARSLGTISETLSRNLRKMRELALIRVRGKEIAILDPARLRALADGERI
jgi:CRP/FNR family transcriptional regulator